MLGRRLLAAAAALLGTLLAEGRASAQSPPAAPEKIALGDWLLSPLLEIRTRAEYRRDAPDLGGLDFYGRLGPRVRDAWVISERSRLGLGVERGAVAAKITLQDARAFGAPSPSGTVPVQRGVPGGGRFEPYEAFLEMRSSGARPTYLRLGRQAVVWGEGRLIGSADFSPAGRALDAARAHLAVGDFDFEALGAILEMPGPLGSGFGDRAGPAYSGVQLYGLSARWTIDPLLRVELFGLARVSRGSGVDLDGSRFALARLSGETYTGALRVSGDAKGWTYGAEGAYQFGRSESLALGGADVSAFAAAGHVSKTFAEVSLTPTIRVAGSYASGDDGGSTYKQFDPLLADPQRFHGQMDLFAWSNMADVSGRAQIVPWTDTSFAVEYRYAKLARSAGDWVGGYLTSVGRAAPSQGYAGAGYAPLTSPPGTELGHEIDAVLTWRPWLPLELRAGWSGLFLGEGARRIMTAHARGKAEPDASLSPAKLAQYLYTQATLTMP
ncbi:MAG: alginate export family protein [Labilithrix sp.]|nr:alginate export family protein [Labilithrix sp.]